VIFHSLRRKAERTSFWSTNQIKVNRLSQDKWQSHHVLKNSKVEVILNLRSLPGKDDKNHNFSLSKRQITIQLTKFSKICWLKHQWTNLCNILANMTPLSNAYSLKPWQSLLQVTMHRSETMLLTNYPSKCLLQKVKAKLTNNVVSHPNSLQRK